MRNLFVCVLTVLALCETSSVRSDVIEYSWSGYFEDSGSNPWGLAGDGSSSTTTDGSPYTINVFVNSGALDTSTVGNQAQFNVTNTTDLKIGGNSVLITDGALRFIDNLDAIVFNGTGTFNGSSQKFSTGLFVPTSTFDLLDSVAPDVPPVFLPAAAIGDTYSSNGSSIYSIVTKSTNASVTVAAVPEPCVVGPLLVGMIGAPLWKRLKKSRKS